MATRLPDVISSRGETCALWEWTPNQPPKGLVVVFHGLAAHTRFPTVRIAAELLSANGYVVCGLDLPGHGASEGLRGYIYSSQALIDDGLAAYWAACKSHPALPTFLIGSSMGAAIAIGVASSLTAEDATPHGIVMLAPMLAPAASPFLSTLVSALAWTPLSRLALISSSATSNEKQYADPAMRAEIESDELAYKGSLRVASVAAVLELGATTEENLEGIRAPFLCCLAEREMILGPASLDAQERLMQVAATPEALRTLKRYDALHGLLCEPQPKRDEIMLDIVSWMDDRVQAAPPVRGAVASV